MEKKANTSQSPGRGRAASTGAERDKGTGRTRGGARGRGRASPAPAPAPAPAAAAAPQKRMTSQKVDRYKTNQTLTTDRKFKTALSAMYARGDVPCRIDHGSVKSRLAWTVSLQELNYDPLLVHCAEGLLEQEHPYVFIARQGFSEMVRAKGAKEKVVPLVERLAGHFRVGLRSKSDDIFNATAEALRDTAVLVGPELLPHLDHLIQPLASKTSSPTCGQSASETLRTLADACGPEAITMIKSKVPTFC